MEPIARQVQATGGDPVTLARALADRLAGPELALALVFVDHRLEPSAFAALQRALPAPVIGCVAPAVIGPGTLPDGAPAAVALGLYGSWLRVGVGVAAELSRAVGDPTDRAGALASGLARGRDAVHAAAAMLGTPLEALEPSRHVALTLFDGLSPQVEAFCIGAAAAAPQLRFVGGGAAGIAAGELPARGDVRTAVWANGALHFDAGVVALLDSDQPFHVVAASHLVATELKTVVTAASGRAIEALDGRPAASQLRRMLERSGEALDVPEPSHALARLIDGVPYVRSIVRVEGERLVLSSAVEPGHILRVMRPGELARTTQRALAAAAERVGGTMAAFVAFSCLARHAEARLRGGRELAAVQAAYPMVGIQTVSEQSGMLLVNHTLAGLAIGALKP